MLLIISDIIKLLLIDFPILMNEISDFLFKISENLNKSIEKFFFWYYNTY